MYLKLLRGCLLPGRFIRLFMEWFNRRPLKGAKECAAAVKLAG